MRVLLVNPPYQTLTSNLGVGHQVPLGLLMVGGSLLKAGHEVSLFDAEARRLGIRHVVKHCRAAKPDMVMTGHAGSTPAHPICARMLRAIRQACPNAATVYGGVFPTYHPEWILQREPAIDVIVRGEGEAAAVELAATLEAHGRDPKGLARIPGIAFRHGDQIVQTEDRPPIRSLDDHPTGWQLIDNWDLYRCFGVGRAAIVQFSRGCPHRCTYCGQHGFWVKWRHRDPSLLADEIAMLHRMHGIRFFTLADENPTTSPQLWKQFLEEIVARQIDVHFFATIRATDIVRDAAILPLYKKAGLLYILLGIDTTNPELQKHINKRSTVPIDAQACRLLRDNGIRSIVGHIVGLGNETWADFRQARRAIDEYDGDLLNAMYATPHSWAQFARESAPRPVVEEDLSRWDYRHQVLGQSRMTPAQLFLAVKLLELMHHTRPRRLIRLFFHPDPFLRHQFRWTALHIGAVWFGEIVEWLLRKRARSPRPLRQWLDDFGYGEKPEPHAEHAFVPLTIRSQREPAHAECT
jgi:anaerobic magnesium-protoporphyrin IX monomethyl ester cyclase